MASKKQEDKKPALIYIIRIFRKCLETSSNVVPFTLPFAYYDTRQLPMGADTAHGVDLLTEVYVIYKET